MFSRSNCESATEFITSVYKDLNSDKKESRKNVEEALKSESHSLDITSKIASHISSSLTANDFIIGLCTKGHAAES